MFQIDSSNSGQLKCTFFSNTPMKKMVHLYKYIKHSPQTSPNVQIYILHCSIPQENVVKNSDFFTHSHLRKLQFPNFFYNNSYITFKDLISIKKTVLQFTAWTLDENTCDSQLHQYSTLTTKAASFNGFREYMLKLECQDQGKEFQVIIYKLYSLNFYLNLIEHHIFNHYNFRRRICHISGY